MQRISNVLAVAALGLFGLWGCSRPAANSISPDRVRALEENNRIACESRDQFAAKLKVTESKSRSQEQEIQRLQAQLTEATRERDDALVSLRQRTAERDQSQSRYDGFRQSLKEMLSQAEAAQGNQKAEGALFSSPMLPEIPH